ncbi:MAG: DUF4845 domain-containing protein [Pseudomonadota bacterium]
MRRPQIPMLARPAQRQRGMTTLGLIIMVIFLGIFAFGIIRLTPLYLNYIKVAGVIDGVVQEFEGQNANRAAVRRSISQRFQVDSVSEIGARDVTVTPVDGGLEVSAVYDHTTPFLGPVSFSVHFDKTVVIRR